MSKKELFYSFIIYSIIGWGIDTLVRSAFLGYWFADNVLGIPVSPIYGLGALGILWLHGHIRHWPMVGQFFVYMFLVSAYEYLGGFISEWWMGRRLWDYSEFPLNIHGYTDPIHGIGWGILSLFLVYWLHPYLRKTIMKKLSFRFLQRLTERK